MSGYPIIFGEGVDPDAYQYFLRAGIESGTQTPSSYDNAASFNGTNQFLSIASNSTLTVTGTSFTYAFWANTPNTSNGMVISKTSGGDTREFQIGLNTGGVAQFGLFPDGTTANLRVISSSASSFSANSWNFFVCRYDSSAATIGISINGGAFTSLGSIPAITQTNTNPLNLGVFVNTASGLNYNGRLAGVGFWKKALTASEVTALFNNGAGRTYASLDSGLQTNLISWWALNQNSVTADSAPTGNNLTNNGTPLVTATTLGPIVTTTQNSRQLINNFVKGIKSLGLWNSMVCWPLRSSQNVGGGITAFSLGGLGAFDGNLINGPAWGSSGINFNKTATQFIGTSLNPNLTNNGIFVCSDWSQISSSEILITAIGNRDIYGASGRGASLGMTNTSNLRAISSPDGTTINSFQITPLPTGFGCHSMLSDGSVLTVNQNNTQVATQTIVSGTTQVSLNIGSALYAQYTYKGVIPFAAAFYAPVSNTAIYNLYKSTLGLGLGLP
jgi:hypothetical protein